MSRNIWFDYLTTAWVQVGNYTVRDFYRRGQHFVQGLGNITNDATMDTDAGAASVGETPTEVYSYTVTQGGNYAITFTVEGDAVETGLEGQVQVNGVDVGAAATTTGAADVTATVALDGLVPGDEITIVATGVDGTPDVNATVSAITLVAKEFEIPETFIREWATLSNGADAADPGYDVGAYGIGVANSSRTIDVPVAKRVHLLYRYDLESTRQERALVQVDASSTSSTAAADLGTSTGIGVVNQDLSRRVFTEDEYWETFAAKGFSRFGAVWPSGMKTSNVGELTSFTGDFVDVAGDTQTDIVLYVNPLYIENGLPLFSDVYLTAYHPSLTVDKYELPGYLLRWRGEPGSSHVAAINRDGSAVARKGPFRGTTETKLTIDGQEYDNADLYNVNNYRRH